MLRFVATGTISRFGSRFILKKLRLYVILTLFGEFTQLVVFVFEDFSSLGGGGVVTLFQCFLVGIAVVTTSHLGFRRALF